MVSSSSNRMYLHLSPRDVVGLAGNADQPKVNATGYIITTCSRFAK